MSLFIYLFSKLVNVEYRFYSHVYIFRLYLYLEGEDRLLISVYFGQMYNALETNIEYREWLKYQFLFD